MGSEETSTAADLLIRIAVSFSLFTSGVTSLTARLFMDLLDELQKQVVIADGAMGTELFAAGVSPLEVCLEELCVSAQEKVCAVHENYLRAGARVIRTNSFGANAVRLARHGLEHRVNELNWTAAQLARDCTRGTGALVGGSVGPLHINPKAAGSPGSNRSAIFTEQIGALLDGGAQLIFLETFLDLEELLVALEAKHTLHHCPVVCSIVLDATGNLRDQTPFEDATAKLRDAGADLIGINCTEFCPVLLEALDRLPSDIPLSIFPSAGLPNQTEDGFHYPVTPEQFARNAQVLVEHGARLLGGCCGASPSHIAALAEAFALPT